MTQPLDFATLEQLEGQAKTRNFADPTDVIRLVEEVRRLQPPQGLGQLKTSPPTPVAGWIGQQPVLDPHREGDWRLAVIHVPVRVLVEFMYNRGDLVPEYVNIPRLRLPDGYRVVSCYHEWPRNALSLLVTHPSLPVVPDGMLPPALDNLLTGDRFLTWDCYILATAAEVAARPIRDIDDPPLVIAAPVNRKS